ncbi:MAG TPA: exosortase/archaeosortase family protein [Candidatus Krumholzibacteria bacterium]|nr:exosortase/archaeosortase family protein [Candidatus Krumholzibacteria bacterium]
MSSAVVLRRPSLPTFALFLTLTAAYWFVLASLVAQWADDPNYAHGFFVVPMALALAWRRRSAWALTPSRPDARGLVLLTVAGVMYLAAILAAELFTMRCSLVLALAAVVWTVEGSARARIMRFPLFFLLAMIPIPYVFYYRLTFPLQLESSRLAAGVLSAMGMPLVRAGNVIHLEGYSLEVVSACSGLRSIMTLGTMALFISDFLGINAAMRAAFLVLVIPIAMLANVARLILTAGLAALEGPQAAESFLHELSGIVVFVVGLSAIAACGKGLQWTARARR